MEKEMDKKIEITISEYKKLLKQAARLNLLDNGGVDNWEWYSESLYPDNDDKTYDDLCEEIDSNF
jgi:hypothetical protein